MTEYSRVSSPFGGPGRYTNPGMVDAIKTYCAIKGISLRQFYVIQGSFNTGVKASAGTHDKADCLDTTDGVDEALLKRIGVAAFARTRAQGFDPHTHMVRMYSTATAWLAEAQEKAYRAHQSNGLGDLSHRDNSWCPRYRGVRHLSGPTTKKMVATKTTWGYSQAGCHSDKDRDLHIKTRDKGWVLENIAGTVRANGSDYYVTTGGTFYNTSNFKAYVPPMRTTEFKVYEQNCASDKSYWSTRSGIIAKRILAVKPQFVAAVELYTLRRAFLSSKIKSLYGLAGYNHGKVQYVINNKTGWAKVGTSKKYDLGNGKHATAIRYRHRTTGADLVIAVPHLTWQHERASYRTAEARKLVSFLKRDYNDLPWLITGDMNDSHKSIASRPNDSSGDVFKAAGLHDLYYDIDDIADKVNREYNTANGLKTPPPKDAVHLDRYWGTAELTGLKWTCDVVDGSEPGDHWGTYMSISIKHPAS